MEQPHLAVNDALRAYMMAQSVLDAVRGQGEINDHIRRIDAHITTYTDDCADALSLNEKWCTAPSTVFDRKHQNFKLARMTLVEEDFEEQEAEKKTTTPPIYDLKYKALFRLVEALSRCGRGPSYNALHLLGDILMSNASGTTKRTFQPFVSRELEALAKHVQDKLLLDVIEGKVSKADLLLTQTGFCSLDSNQYDFADRPINYNILNNCILTVDTNSIIQYEYKFGMPALLVAAQDVFKGMVLFTESLPFVVSTANTPDQSELATICDTCGTDLQMLSPFVLRVLSEELKQAEAEEAERKRARVARKEARARRSPAPHRTVAVDTPTGESQPSSRVIGKNKDENISLGTEQEDDDDDWDSESSSGASETSLANITPDTPLRGRITSRPGIFETSDVQICRYGVEKQRENFSFCSVDCYDLAKATYHDSLCGSHIEDYLRKSIIQVEVPGLLSVDTQKLVLLLLVRILGWAYATSTDPLDLPVIQMFMASPRHSSLKNGPPVPWSFHNNVMRPYQMYQAMDGRGDSPKSVINPDYSDGSILNTIISLIHRHMVTNDQIVWTKTYDEDGYHEQTYPYADKKDAQRVEENTLFGRLHPLCDLVPLAPRPEEANVELVDLGGGQIACLPLLNRHPDDEDSDLCIKKGTRLLLRNATPRLATKDERATYAKVEDYGEGGTMMDVEQDDGILGDHSSDDEPQTEEQEEEFSGYVDEETYGADDDYMADAEWDIDEDDEEMMSF
ncbi:hypothetical protein KCU95_g9574, partial [Aureobasidium melanogenum]